MMIEKMKPSGIEWIGDIPINWFVTKIKYSVQSVGSGTTPDSGNPLYYEDGSYSWIQSGDLYDTDYIWETEKKITQKAISDFPALSWNYKDFVVVAMYGASVGNVAISKIDSFTNQACCTLKAKACDDLRYLYYFLTVAQEDMLQKAFGGTQPNISQTIIKNLVFLKVPDKEQSRIAGFLDNQCAKIDSIIADIEKQIELLQKYKKSLITETVTKGLDRSVPMKDSGIEWIGKIPTHWDIKRLKYLGTARNGLTYDPSDVVDEGVLVLRSSNIQNGRLAFDDNVYVNMAINENILLKENDILMCVRNGSRHLIGKCALIDADTAGNTYGAFMCVFRSKWNKYIHYIFQSNLFEYYLGTFLTSTVNQLTNGNLYNIKAPFTFNEEEQRQIVEFLDRECAQVDFLIENKQAQLSTMQQHKKSLIYEYVTGKKRVTEVN